MEDYPDTYDIVVPEQQPAAPTPMQIDFSLRSKLRPMERVRTVDALHRTVRVSDLLDGETLQRLDQE